VLTAPVLRGIKIRAQFPDRDLADRDQALFAAFAAALDESDIGKSSPEEINSEIRNQPNTSQALPHARRGFR
jgi:hypothetical protein